MTIPTRISPQQAKALSWVLWDACDTYTNNADGWPSDDREEAKADLLSLAELLDEHAEDAKIKHRLDEARSSIAAVDRWLAERGRAAS